MARVCDEVQAMGTAIHAESEAAAAGREVRLFESLHGLGRVLVAFSAGVDSTYLAWAARQALGPRTLAVTGVSESLASGQKEEAVRLAAQMGIAHRLIDTGETADPRYLANTTERCYFCKSDLYSRLAALAAAEGFAAVVDGTNADDLGDVRPGRRAAGELKVRSPLAEVGLGKIAIRLLSRRAGLVTWDRPASPCLSSRIPHFTPVTPARLHQVDRAEAGLRGLGFREFRVRHHGELGRVELAAEELGRALDPEVSPLIYAAVKAAGFANAAIDVVPFRSGRLRDESATR